MLQSLNRSLSVLSLSLMIVGLVASQSRAAMIHQSIYQSDFSGATLGSEWSNAFTSGGKGSVDIRSLPESAGVLAGSGRRGLSLQQRGGTPGWALSAVDLTVDLSQYSDVSMVFNHYVNGDVPNMASPVPVLGYGFFDGISISDDGLVWHAIWSPTTTSTEIGGAWTENQSLNISQAIAANGLTHSSNFQIRFQQYSVRGTQPLASYGRGFDGINISGAAMPSAVPEPTTLGLLGIGLVCSLVSSTRRRVSRA